MADPAYEIFHDVLAPTILDWYPRHTEGRAAEARLGARLELSAEQTRAAEERAHRYRQWLKRVSLVALVLLLALASTLAALAVRAQHAAVKAQVAAHSQSAGRGGGDAARQQPGVESAPRARRDAGGPQPGGRIRAPAGAR